MYAVHQPENRTPTYANFTDPTADAPPVGVQLVVAASPDDDLFGPFRQAMISEPDLLAAYNELKRQYDGSDYDTYTHAKADFIERVMSGEPATGPERALLSLP